VDFEHNQKTKDLLARVEAFMEEHVYPAEPELLRQLNTATEFGTPQLMRELQAKARSEGLWNLFYKHGAHGLNNVEFAPLCEAMSRVYWSQAVFNSMAPDTGNIETLEAFGTEEQKARWMVPLLAGEITSAFAMTEPDVASSDATNIKLSIHRDGDEFVVNGRKWWTSGVSDPECELLIVLGRDADADQSQKHGKHTMLLIPRDTPGITVVRNLTVFGYNEWPHGHGEVLFENVRVPADAVVLGAGRGFEVAQGRLGPGRIHYGMRCIGLAERALELMCKRTLERETFGAPIATRTVTLERIAEARIMIDQTRLLVLNAAHLLDTVGVKGARKEVAMIKVAAPNMACQVIDWAIQAHGGAGLSADTPLAYYYSRARLMRIGDGPDEVHRNSIGKLELARYKKKA